MNLSIATSWILFGSMAWMGAASLDILRKQTLAKNMDWVLEHPEFLRRHLRAPLWPLLALTLICMVVVAFGYARLPVLEAAYLKNGAILAAAGVLCAVHSMQEKRIAGMIPRSEHRSASLRPRNAAAYAPKVLRGAADAGLLLAGAGGLVAWVAGAVADSFAATFGGSVVILAASVAWGRWAILSEKSPHFQQVRRITDKDLSENYRRFSLQLLLAVQLGAALLLAAQLGAQLAGWQLVHNPFQEALRGVFGETAKLPLLVRFEHYDAAGAVLAGLLVALLPSTSAFQDIRKIDLLGTRAGAFRMNLTILVALAAFAADPQVLDSLTPDERRQPMIAIDFLPSPFQWAGDVGGEWLFWPRAGLGVWASASAGRGENWLSGQDNDLNIYQAGLTWHPSRRLRSNAIYARYYMGEFEQGIAVEPKKVHVLRYESQQVRVGVLGRHLLWKRLGFFWNAGLGFKAGTSRAEWVGPVPEDGKTLAGIVRVMGYLDLGYGLSLEL